MKHTSIAIDGPSGAGKSTLAKALAAKLNFLYVDTGAIYRTIALYFYRKEIHPGQEKEVLEHLSEIRVALHYGGDGLASVAQQ